MFVIGRMPARLKGFFGNLEAFFEKRQWPHFWSLVLAFALAHGRRNIAHLNLFLEDKTLRQRRQDFLVRSPWDGATVAKAGARAVLDSLDPKNGERLELLLDLTHAPKRGKTMEGVHRYFDPVTKSYQVGHAFLVCVLRFREIAIPWDAIPWLPKAFCRSERGKELGIKFRTSNEIAADVIRSFPPDLATFFKVRVLFDSGFLNEEVVGACQERGFNFISVAKSNRVLFPNGYAGKRRVSSYGPGVVRTHGQTIAIETARGKAKFRVAVRDGFMRGIGDVRVVFSQRLSDRSFVALVTDDMELKPRDVVRGYRARWTIEVTLKMLKQCLGLGHYQTTRYEGLVHHLHLCLISLQLLTTLGVESPATEELQGGAAIESIPCLQDHLRMIITKDHFSRLRQAKSPARLLSRLKELLVAA
jgi:hypothetical protein